MSGQWVTIEKSIGKGNLVLTSQDASYHAQYGAGDAAGNSAEPDEVPRISTGSLELDDILGGGLDRNRMYPYEGRPGTGKTTLALQFCWMVPAGASGFSTSHYPRPHRSCGLSRSAMAGGSSMKMDERHIAPTVDDGPGRNIIPHIVLEFF